MSSGWSYEQGMKFEVARGLINTRIARISARIGAEEAKPQPDMSVVEALEREMLDLGFELDRLDVTDEAAIDATIARYRHGQDSET